MRVPLQAKIDKLISEKQSIIKFHEKELSVQTQIQIKYKKKAEDSQTEIKSLKNVLRIPRLNDLYRKKMEFIREEMNLKNYYREQNTKTTSEIK